MQSLKNDLFNSFVNGSFSEHLDISATDIISYTPGGGVGVGRDVQPGLGMKRMRRKRSSM